MLLGETLEDAVRRVLIAETGLTLGRMHQKGTLSLLFDGLQAITTLYHVEVNGDKVVLNSDHSEYRWIRDLDEGYHKYIKDMVQAADVI